MGKRMDSHTAQTAKEECLDMFDRTLGVTHPKTIKARFELNGIV